MSDEQDWQTSLSNTRAVSNKKQRSGSYQVSSSVNTSNYASDVVSQRGRPKSSSAPSNQSSQYRAILPARGHQSPSPGTTNSSSYAEIRANRMCAMIIALVASV